MQVKTLRVAVLAIEILIGLGALAPGWAMLRDPSGASLGLQPAWLARSPFVDYTVPGLFLFTVIGLGNLGLATFHWVRPAPAAKGTAAMGAFLMVWIGLQWVWLEPHSWLQPAVFGLGAVLLGLGLKLSAALKGSASSRT